MGPTDKEDINFVEAYKMLLHMERAKHPEPRSAITCVTDTLADLFAPQEKEGEDDSDSDEEEPIAADPMNTITKDPNAQSEIPLTISRNEIRQGFKIWTERTATSPSGRHLGH